MGSSRLPGKPLLALGDSTVLHQTYLNAQKSGANKIIIATDHAQIHQHAKDFGAHAVMTKQTHLNGTERLAEVAELLKFSDDEIVVNVQGDEPFAPCPGILSLARALNERPIIPVASLACPIETLDDLNNPNVVKCVQDAAGCAMYFSRACIPYQLAINSENKNPNHYQFLRHLGLYAYRASTLKTYKNLKPSPLELVENLEQLRLLHHGLKIYLAMHPRPLPPGIDTLEDLKQANLFLNN